MNDVQVATLPDPAAAVPDAVASALRSVNLEPAANYPTMDVPPAGRLADLGRDASYAAVKAGKIPSIWIGGRCRVLTVPWLRQLGLIS